MIRINIRKPNRVSSIISIGFVILGVYLIRKALFVNEGISRYVILFIGVFNILLFGTFLYFIVSRFFDNESGLQIDDEKIIFKPNKFQNAEIYWKDIIELKFKTQRGQHYILPIIANPEATIATQNNWIGKRVMKINFRQYLTPILILASNYESSFEELKKMMVDRFNSVKNKKGILAI